MKQKYPALNQKDSQPVSTDDLLLKEGLLMLGLEAEKIAPIESTLIRYIAEIELFNPAYGLVKVQDRRELIVKHILDSLAPINFIRDLLNKSKAAGSAEVLTPQVADIGSGAGLPGIPLAACLPGIQFSLVERMGRRAGFLRNTLAVLNLPNLRVEETELEKIAVSAQQQFDLLVFRAFRPLEPSILKCLLKLLKPGGTLAAYKGRRLSVEEEMSPWENLHWEVFPLEVPFLKEERHLLFIHSKP